MSDEHLEWLSIILALTERIANGSLDTNWRKETRDPALFIAILKAEVFETLLSDEARWPMRRQLMAFTSLVEALELPSLPQKHQGKRGHRWRNQIYPALLPAAGGGSNILEIANLSRTARACPRGIIHGA